MRPLVNLQVLRSRKQFSTSGEGARERFLPRVYPDVVDELVLCFEGEEVSAAVLPVAHILVGVEPCHMFVVDVTDDVLHDGELFVARFRFGKGGLVDPHAGQDLVSWLTEVPG